MTPEVIKQLITDSIKHDLNNEPLDPELRQRWGFFSHEDLTEYLCTQAEIFEETGRSLEESMKRYIQHVISQPDGASQLREKYGLVLSNNPGNNPTPTVQTT